MTIQSIRQLPTYSDFEHVKFSRDPKDYEMDEAAFNKQVFKRLEGLSLLEAISMVATGAMAAYQVATTQDPLLPLKATKLNKEQYDQLVYHIIDHQPKKYDKSPEFLALFDSARRAYILYFLARDIKAIFEEHGITFKLDFNLEDIQYIILDAFEDYLLEEVGFKKAAVLVKALFTLHIKEEWETQKWWLDSVYEKAFLGSIASKLHPEKREALQALPRTLDKQIERLLGKLYPIDPEFVEDFIESYNENFPSRLLVASEKFVSLVKEKAYENISNEDVLIGLRNELMKRIVLDANATHAAL